MSPGLVAIGLQSPKDKYNLGGVMRAANCYGASLVVCNMRVGETHLRGDTDKARKKLPLLQVEDLQIGIPFGAVPIAIDLVEGAVPLHQFEHPRCAYYVFGPEDGTLGEKTLSWCKHKVYIPTHSCMNLAATVNVVLYDRAVKRGELSDLVLQAHNLVNHPV